MINAIAFLTGAEPIPLPTVDDIAAWRAYLMDGQARLLADDPELTPTQALGRVLPAIRAEYKAAFPAGDDVAFFDPAADEADDKSGAAS